MSVYGDFDVRFRPRATFWRLALAGFAQTVVASLIASALLGACDMLILRRAGLRKAWLVHAAPWSRLTGVERLSGFAPLVAASRRDAAPVLAAAVAVLAIIIYFWPFRPTLGTRMFAMTLVQMLLLFAAWPLVVAAHLGIAAAIVAVVLWFVARAEGAIASDLANDLDMQTPLRRLLVWIVRVVPAASTLGAAAYLNGYVEGWIAAIAYAAVTLLVALGRRPPSRYEKLEGVELREAAAAMPIVALVLVALAYMTFGSGSERRVVVITKRVDVMPIVEARARMIEWWGRR